MRIYPRGAEWRKWDLHVHAPGTKLSDGYGSPPPWNEYCRIIEESDVAVIGITDYFSFDSYFQFLEEHHARYPSSEKVFFANLELRLNETVNAAKDEVHLHLLFRSGIAREDVARLLDHLHVQHSEQTGRKRACSQMEPQDYASATVTRQDVKNAIAEVFGDPEHAAEQLLVLVPANNDGIRASDSQRKRQLADEIERDCDALFGSATNCGYFLDPDRYETDISAVAKPVFAGSDAHNLKDLQDWLGKSVDNDGQHKQTTWIKADPNFEGLTQTLVEPAERVRIQPTKPNHKEPYKIIDRVRFHSTREFPAEIVLNQNLVSVIGSRSSGKSALLAYIAHSIDPEATINEQQATQGIKREELGPAAGKTWADVADIQCEVIWAEPGEHTGRVIYIPQNSLHAISQRPHEITEKIAPAVFRLDPEFLLAHEKAGGEIEDANQRIGEAVERWFQLTGALKCAERELREIGDQEAIEETRDQLQGKIARLQQESSLSEQETLDYQKLIDRLQEIQTRLAAIAQDSRKLDTYFVTGGGEQAGESTGYRLGSNVRLAISLSPDTSGLPEPTQTEVRDLIDEARQALTGRLEQLLAGSRASLEQEHIALTGEDATLREKNKELIAKNAANSEIETLIKERQTQEQALEKITLKRKDIEQLIARRDAQVTTIEPETARRSDAQQTLAETFARQEHTLDEMCFGLEQAHDGAKLATLAGRFNQWQVGPFIDRGKDKRLLIEKAQQKPSELLAALEDGTQPVMKGQDPEQLAADVLVATPEVRFYAEMEDDRIGGFRTSSMTPGKQALFALTLILGQSDHAWPLLIDQPEDDLDSRSVYQQLVGYLTARKAERQIVMVSHDANLVIGADSEQVIVANRHGQDRKNPDGQLFAYRSGSLEHSQPKDETDEHVLDSCGIREHACELLDGGEEAFRKRKAKYKL
jgi:ABC-type cobalamin/Fe3+-siderophores transport system ATPase subunit